MDITVLSNLDLNNNDILNSNLAGGGAGAGAIARVSKTINQSIADNTPTFITWDSEEYDTGDFHDDVTNNTRFTIPRDGNYAIRGYIEFAVNGTGFRRLTIRKNGTSNISLETEPPNGSEQDRMSVVAFAQLEANDYVECRVTQTSGGNLDVFTNSRFEIVELTGGGGGGGGGDLTVTRERYRHSASFPVTGSASTPVTFDTAVDTETLWNKSTGAILQDGIYRLTLYAQIENPSMALNTSIEELESRIFLNGTGIATTGIQSWNNTGFNGPGGVTSVLLELTTSDVITFSTFIWDSSAANTYNLEALSSRSQFEIVKLEGGAGVSIPVTGASVTRLASFSLPDSTLTPIQWETIVRDEESYADLVANNTRLTIPEDGWYTISGTVATNDLTNPQGYLSVFIRRNGLGSPLAEQREYIDVTGTEAMYVNVTGTYYLSADDYLELQVFHNLGAGVNTRSVASGNTALDIVKLTNQEREQSVRVSRTSSVSIPNQTFTVVDWEQEEFDYGSLWDISSPSLFVAQESGRYVAMGVAEFDDNSTGDRIAVIQVNGTTKAITRIGAAPGFNTRMPISTIVDLTIGDEVRFGVDQSSGGNLDLLAGSTHFEMIKYGNIANVVQEGDPVTLASDNTYVGTEQDWNALATVTASTTLNGVVVDPLTRLLGESGAGFSTSGNITATGEWIEIELNTPQQFNMASWGLDRVLASGSSKWKWQASSDGVTWLTISSELDLLRDTTLVNEEHRIVWLLEAPRPYRYYRIIGVSGTFSFTPRYLPFNFWLASGGGSGGGGAGRELLTADRTYYVATTGSDANDGLTVGNPFLTIQKAIDVGASLDAGIYQITIQIADGTYNITTPIELKDPVTTQRMIIQGNTGNQASVIIDGGATSNRIFSAVGSKKCTVQFLTMQNVTQDLVFINGDRAHVQINDCNWTNPGATFRGIYLVSAEVFVRLAGTHNFSGSGTYTAFAYLLASNAQLTTNAATINVSGSPTFSTAFFLAQRLALMNLVSTTVTGSYTGTGINVSGGSRAFSAGATIPGGTSVGSNSFIQT